MSEVAHNEPMVAVVSFGQENNTKLIKKLRRKLGPIREVNMFFTSPDKITYHLYRDPVVVLTVGELGLVPHSYQTAECLPIHKLFEVVIRIENFLSSVATLFSRKGIYLPKVIVADGLSYFFRSIHVRNCEQENKIVSMVEDAWKDYKKTEKPTYLQYFARVNNIDPKFVHENLPPHDHELFARCWEIVKSDPNGASQRYFGATNPETGAWQ